MIIQCEQCLTKFKLDDTKVKALPEADQKIVSEVQAGSKQLALTRVTIFPLLMLVVYLGLIFYFKSKGGYKPVDVGQH